MSKIMLIDASAPEETRVAVMEGKRLDNFDIESAAKKQLKGNIYLAKVTRVEPSLQAAFVSYGGNRHGFLPFAEIHPDYYRIPVEDRERLLAEQEELSRQLQAEAKAREEREIAEAEARAANPEAFAAEDARKDAEADAAYAAEVSDLASGIVREEEAREETYAVEADRAEVEQSVQPDASPLDAQGDDEDEDGEDEEDDDADEEDGDETEDQAPGDIVEGEAGEQPEGVITGEANAEQGEGEAQGEGRNRGRGRGRGRGRNRGRGRGRGLERRPDQVVDREGGNTAPRDNNHGDEEETGMTPLWKRMHRSYKIQEVIKRGQIMLIQVVKEERGNKGAAVTSYITMPGRYCVLMPNSPQSGGVSRKVSSHADRRKMRDLLDELQVPQGMSVILRTAGVDRAPEEVKRDLDYLMRLWDKVRDTTMQSTAPALIHEEGSLVKRAVRDLFSSDISEIVVEGAEAAQTAREVMSMMMPERERVIREYKDAVPLFIKHGAEPQIDAIHSNTVTLRSGGYLVINPTEALVSIDINSGRATRERHIEETAVKTNLEAADEIARQLRLRDLGGLVVIDFIDMENRRNNAAVEKRMRDALSGDRARVQVGRISSFGLMELSRQRLRPSLTETHFHTCPHCRGLGIMRTTEALALAVLRAIETIGMENRAGEVQVTVTQEVATFLFNSKRASLTQLEKRYDLAVVLNIAHMIENDHGFIAEVSRTRRAERLGAIDAVVDGDLADEDGNDVSDDSDDGDQQPESNASGFEAQIRGGREGGRNGPRADNRNSEGGNSRRRGRRGGRNRFRDGQPTEGNGNAPSDIDVDDDIGNRKSDAEIAEANGNFGNGEEKQPQANREGGSRGEGNREGGKDGARRRGRRGGRNRNRGDRPDQAAGEQPQAGSEPREQREPRAQREPREPRPNNGNQNQQRPASAETVYASQPRQQQSEGASESRVRDYEVVNEHTGDKKKGWWKKLTG